MKNNWLIFLFLLLSVPVFSQMKGIVYGTNDKGKAPIFGAKLKLLQAKIGTITSDEGTFELILPKILPDTLVISAFGYYSDTILLDKKDRFISLEINLFSDKLLPEILVEIRRETHAISRLKTLHVEEINSGELAFNGKSVI